MIGQKRALLGAAVGLAAASMHVGCGAKSDVPVGNAAESLRELTLAYVQFAAANRGVGPANKETLAKYMAKQRGVAAAEVEKLFVSPRDNQPYVVRWGLRPTGTKLPGPDPPKPPVIIFEATGADGTRYVADGQMSIKELSEEAFAQAVPDQQPAGK